jgi:DNA-binding transcriptional ArsR family regulator
MRDVPITRELGDPASLKVLGQPLRQQILRRLHRSGPATATTLAVQLGENTGVTSYHLRRLADHDFVEEVPELAKGRERWWRARPQDIRFLPRSAMTEEARLAFDTMTQLDAAADEEALGRFWRARDGLGPWGDALLFSRSALRLAPHELISFWEDYLALVMRYRQDEPPDGTERGPADPDETTPQSRRILVRFLAFPDVD